MKKTINHNILFLGHGYISQYFCRDENLEKFNIRASINSSKDRFFKTPPLVKTVNFLEINEELLDDCNIFVISIPPFYQLKTDVIIEKFYDYFLKRKTPYKLIYLSATSVYGDHQGKLVQENSELKAESTNGLARIECENKYLQLQKNPLANIIILRLSGIYGEKRNSLLSILSNKITQNKPSNKIISRIHAADIIAIIKAVILSSKISNQIFNLADNKPCPTIEVNNYICEKLLKINKLPIGGSLKDYGRSSFLLDSKIIDNSKLKKTLNYEFIFPSYEEGMKQIMNNLD